MNISLLLVFQYYKNDYDSIIFKDNLFETFIYYNCFKPLKWFYNKIKFNFNNSIILSIENNNLDILKFLVSISGNINKLKYLKLICKKGYLDILIYLKSIYININIKDKLLLILAVEYGNYNIVEFLLNKGSNVNIFKNNPLIIAVSNNHYYLIKILINYILIKL